MTAALYIRVSTDDQLEFSPDAQKRALLEYAKKNNMMVSEEHIYVDEGISGTSAKKRPAFQNMIATAKKKPKPFDAILVHKFDRFARSREDSVVYKSLLRKECDIKVISITEQLEDDKFSVILEAMLEAMAEYYSLNLSDEVMKGMSEKARRGKVQCSSPYGYQVTDNELLQIPNEADIVKLIFNKFVEENNTYGEICAYLNTIGVKNKKGNPFEKRNIKYILQNPVYCGLVRWNYASQKGGVRKLKDKSEWIITQGNHEPIISKELYEQAQHRINETNKIYTKTKISADNYGHWLGGIVRCSSCQNTLTVSGSKDYKYYECNKYKKGGCRTPNRISIKKLEKNIIEALKHDLFRFEKITAIPKNVAQKDNEDEKALIEKQLEKVRRKYDIARNAYLAEIDTIDEYKANKEMIVKEETKLVKMLNDTNNTPAIEINKHFKNKLIEALLLLEDNEVEISLKNNMLKSFISQIIYNKQKDSLEIKYYK